jgi:hypothetical protein
VTHPYDTAQRPRFPVPGTEIGVLDVTMNVDDPTVQVTFDLGKSAADVYIDNVSLVEL